MAKEPLRWTSASSAKARGSMTRAKAKARASPPSRATAKLRATARARNTSRRPTRGYPKVKAQARTTSARTTARSSPVIARNEAEASGIGGGDGSIGAGDRDCGRQWIYVGNMSSGMHAQHAAPTPSTHLQHAHPDANSKYALSDFGACTPAMTLAPPLQARFRGFLHKFGKGRQQLPTRCPRKRCPEQKQGGR